MPVIFNGWKMWITYAVINTLIAIFLTLATDYIFYKEDLYSFVTKIINIFIRRKKKTEEQNAQTES